MYIVPFILKDTKVLFLLLYNFKLTCTLLKTSSCSYWRPMQKTTAYTYRFTWPSTKTHNLGQKRKNIISGWDSRGNIARPNVNTQPEIMSTTQGLTLLFFKCVVERESKLIFWKEAYWLKTILQMNLFFARFSHYWSTAEWKRSAKISITVFLHTFFPQDLVLNN